MADDDREQEQMAHDHPRRTDGELQERPIPES
jgi:hypothetical protein